MLDGVSHIVNVTILDTKFTELNTKNGNVMLCNVKVTSLEAMLLMEEFKCIN